MKIRELVSAIKTESAKELAEAVVDKLDIEDIKVEATEHDAYLTVDLSIPETKLTVSIRIGRVLPIERR